MAGIDNRIVTMKFDNAQFESGARTSLSTLEKLKQSMNFGTVGATAFKALGGIQGIFAKLGIKNPFSTAEKGAADLGKAASSVGTGGLASLDGAVTGVSNRFLAMSTIAITALSNITSKAMQTGQQMVSSLTVDPIKGGLQEYETNLNSIQTILANTKVAGTGLPEVNAALDELNEYSDKTIYNFSEMAKNIGTFTAAGVDLDTSVASIKGIANLAALSGSNSQQAATAMYQLSQEIAAGRVSLMGWNSVVNAGMGGSTFQRALVNTAKTMGTLEGRTVEFTGKMKNATIDGMSFRDSIMAKPGEQSWLSKEVLTGTLAQFTGDMTKAELAAEGFTEAQIKDIQEMAKTASDAATKVKTLSGVFDTAKEVVGSGWAKTWQLVFGDFKEARKFFTDFSIGFNDILGGIADKRNEVLSQWKLRGGRDLAIEGLKTLWESLLTILKPIGKAFRDIFPRTTARDLMDMTRGFVEFAKNLRIGKETAEGLKDTFRGVFAIFSIIGQVIGAVAHGIGELFGAFGEGSGGFLNFTGGLGNAIVAFDEFLEKSGILKSFFGSLAGLLSVPIKLLSGLADILGTMFDSFDASGAKGATNAMGSFSDAAEGLSTGAERLGSIFEGLWNIIENVGDAIVEGISNIGTAIAEVLSPETFSQSLDVINTALLGGIVLMLKKFFSGGLNVDVGGGFFSSITEAMSAATGVLQDMQTNLKADILLKIAAALGVMALSLLILASIKGEDLAKALAAMAAGFAVLGGVMVALIKYIGPIGSLKLPLIASAMVLLASSMLILALAFKIFASMHPLDIAQGLIAIAAALTILTKAAQVMSKNPAGMIRAAAAMILLGLALNIIAAAMKVFATMSWEEMLKGLAGVAGSLTAIAIAMRLMPKGILLQAAAILILSVALNALAGAVKIFATMNWVEMGKGAAALAGSLTLIAIAMRLMPKNMLFQAAALLVVSVALNAVAAAMKVMGGMSWEEIGRGLALLGGAMLILAVGLNAMGVMGIAGAAALLVAAGALAVLVPILVVMGSLGWETIVKSLVMLAGVFVVLGLGALALAPLLPIILALSGAMVIFGAGLALAGVGALAFATAISILVATGSAAMQMMIQVLGTIIAAIPPFFTALGKAIGDFAAEIAKNGPQFTAAMVTVGRSLLNAAEKLIPKAGRVFRQFIDEAIRTLRHSIPRMAQAGFDILMGVLNAIDNNLDKVIDKGGDIVVTFIKGISRNGVKIVNAGFDALIDFLRGIEKAIRENDDELIDAGLDVADAIADGVVKGLSEAAGRLKDAAVNAAKDALQAAKDWLLSKSPSKRARDWLGKPIPQGMAIGIEQEAYKVENAAVNMGQNALGVLRNTMDGMSDALALEADMQPVIAPVLDLTQMAQEASKMSGILAVSPIMANVSYQTAADISAMTQPPEGGSDGGPDAGDGGPGGPSQLILEQHLHSPKPIDSVESYRAGKTLISLAKEALP